MAAERAHGHQQRSGDCVVPSFDLLRSFFGLMFWSAPDEFVEIAS